MIAEYITERSTYEGKPLITIYMKKGVEVKKVLSFGTAKAEAILAVTEDIKSFVEDNKKK